MIAEKIEGAHDPHPNHACRALRKRLDAIRAKNDAKAKDARAVGATVGPVERPVARPE